MEKAAALAVFESLASGTRLDVFRLLVRTGTDGMVAGEIAAALEVPANSLSFHLKALTHAGLLSVEPQGRFLRYRANLTLMRDLIGYPTTEFCSGTPERCAEVGTAIACADSLDC